MAYINDLKAEVASNSYSITPSAKTADETGSGVDVTEGNAVIEFIKGSWTDGTHSFTISGSDDGGSSWTAVSTGEKLNGTEPTISGTSDTGSSEFVVVQNRANYDQIRVSSSVTGATTGAVYGANVLVINSTTA